MTCSESSGPPGKINALVKERMEARFERFAAHRAESECKSSNPNHYLEDSLELICSRE
jgi:hypothetical protein